MGKAKDLGGYSSHGMVMCANATDGKTVELIVPPEGCVCGERVFFDGVENEPEGQYLSGNVLKRAIQCLNTDTNCTATYKNKKDENAPTLQWMTKSGPCKSKTLTDSPIS